MAGILDTARYELYVMNLTYHQRYSSSTFGRPRDTMVPLKIQRLEPLTELVNEKKLDDIIEGQSLGREL